MAKWDKKKMSFKKWLLLECADWGKAFLYAIVVGTIIRLFVFDMCLVPTQSMASTIDIGDRVFINKIQYMYNKPQRGDIVSFWTPTANKQAMKYIKNSPVDLFFDIFTPEMNKGHVRYVKRLIGLPGDEIRLVKVTDEKWEKIKKGEKVPAWLNKILNTYGSPDYIPAELKNLIAQVQINGKTPEKFDTLYYLIDGIFATEDYYKMMNAPGKFNDKEKELVSKSEYPMILLHNIIDPKEQYLNQFHPTAFKLYNEMMEFSDAYKKHLADKEKTLTFRDKDGNIVLKVPQGYTFMMGDNSAESLDSRFWGIVPVENIIGTGDFIVFPFKKAGKI